MCRQFSPHLHADIIIILTCIGGTRTDKALRLAEKAFFCSGCNPTGKPKVLLVITDGNTNPGSEDLAVATKNMKVQNGFPLEYRLLEQGLAFFVLGILLIHYSLDKSKVPNERNLNDKR